MCMHAVDMLDWFFCKSFAFEVIAVKQLFEIEKPAYVGCTMCSGEKFEWDNFPAPIMRSKRGWLLAGGLTLDNVGTAVSLVRPVAVDVSSGIAGPNRLRKKIDQIQAFIKAGNSESLSGVWQCVQLKLIGFHSAVLQTYLNRRVSMSRSLYVEICTACCVGPRRKCFLVDATTFRTNCKWFCKSSSVKKVTIWSHVCCGTWIPCSIWIWWNHFGPIWVSSFLISKCKLEKFFQNSLAFCPTKLLVE